MFKKQISSSPHRISFWSSIAVDIRFEIQLGASHCHEAYDTFVRDFYEPVEGDIK